MDINEIAQWVIDNRYPKRELEKVSDHELYYGLVEKVTALPTNWTPITGEESLPKDDEALCLFVWFFESTNTPSTHSLFCQWKYLRLLSDYEDISSKYTHYTILTKPKQ